MSPGRMTPSSNNQTPLIKFAAISLIPKPMPTDKDAAIAIRKFPVMPIDIKIKINPEKITSYL